MGRKNFSKIKFVGKNKVKTILKFLSFIIFTKPGTAVITKTLRRQLDKIFPNEQTNYRKWIVGKLNRETLRKEFDEVYPTLSYRPKISIVVPVYDPPEKFFRAAIESVLDQFYTNLELCLADDCSPNPAAKQVMEEYREKDPRVRTVYRDKNGHISASSNSALELATGDYILFMDHDDLLTPNCLSEVVRHLNGFPEDEVIYSDEDKVDEEEVLDSPHYKPDWAPDNLLSRNYFGHVVVMKKTLVDKIGGFREGLEGSQDYDIILRAVEQTNHIGHIPKVLYHWRIHSASVAMSADAKPYAYTAAKRALTEALERRGTPGTVEDLPGIMGSYRIRHHIATTKRVSIIIPTKDQVRLLKTTLDSIFANTAYPDYEVVLLDNGSTTPEFKDLAANYPLQHPNMKVVTADFPFNFSKLMNLGVKHCTGDYLLFLNNDVKIIDKEWMTTMVSFAQRKHTGVVGVKLLYPDETIQHAGVVLGLDGPAGHVFVGSYKEENGYYGYIRSLNNYAVVTFACAMCRREVYTELGGMDENLPVEYNDVDFCLQAYKAGYFNVYVPDVEVIHYESSSRGHPFQSKEAYNRHVHDLNVFTGKWGYLLQHDPFYNPNLSSVHAFALKFD